MKALDEHGTSREETPHGPPPPVQQTGVRTGQVSVQPTALHPA